MAKPYTVHVMKKDLETVQKQMKVLMREVADLKVNKVSPESAVASELCAAEGTESSETVEALVRADQDVIENRLKTVEEELEALKSSLAEKKQKFQPDKSMDVKDKDGKTQLKRAVEARDIVKITILLKKGADANVRDNNGQTLLHYAAATGYADVCALLLLMGNADVNATLAGGGSTPLHWAIGGNHVNVVDILLKCGADMKLKISDGQTAYDQAITLGHKEIARLLDVTSNRNIFSSK